MSKPKLIFVATPYSDPNRMMEKYRYVMLNAYIAKLFQNQQYAVAPVAIGHPLALEYKLPGDYNFWKTYSREMLSRCDEVHVLTLLGWDKSIGVADEIALAKELNIPVIYISKEEIE